MKKTLGCIRKADNDFGLIEDGDHIAVGVSGGKDSMLLLEALSLYKKFIKKQYDLTAITIGPGLGFDPAPIRERCSELGIPFVYQDARIVEIALEKQIKDKAPCPICAKLRRGALNNLAKENGCNKVALAHHSNDVLETLLMSMFFEGRMYTLSPKSYLSRTGITLIRPFVYLEERHIKGVVKRLQIRVIESACPIDGHTKREEIKNFISEMRAKYKRCDEMMLSALKNTDSYNLWDKYKIKMSVNYVL